VLTAGQFDELAQAALLVNRGKVDVPFLRAASTYPAISASE
jgi:hypothetical protein